MSYLSADPTQATGVAPTRGVVQEQRRGIEQPPPVLSVGGAGALRRARHPHRRGGDGEGGWRFPAAGDREAVRPRPRHGGCAQRGAPQVLARGPALPHRSLSRQGHGPEHPGLPLRQHALRASLELPVHRPRADHRGRERHRRAPRRLLRLERRAPRHDPEPPPADAGDGGDRGPGLHRREPAQREDEGALGDTGAANRQRDEVGPPRPVRGLSQGTRRTRRARRPQPTPRCASRWRTGAGEACPSICAPARGSRIASAR